MSSQTTTQTSVTVEGISPNSWVDDDGVTRRARSRTGRFEDTPEGHAEARQAAKDMAASSQYLDADNDGWTFRAIRVTRTVVTTTTETTEAI